MTFPATVTVILTYLTVACSAQADDPFSCPMRQLAFTYADTILGGRGTANVAAALNLKTTNDTAALTDWVTCPNKQSILSGTCNGPTAPCSPTSGNFNAGPLPSLVACEALCLASSANFSCRAVQWHGPAAGAWAKVCVLQAISAYQPLSGASAHNAACIPGGDFPACSASCGKGPAPGPAPSPSPSSTCNIPTATELRGPTPTMRTRAAGGSGAAAAGADSAAAFYVDAVHGSDTAGTDGSQGHPFQSLHHAQLAARKANVATNGGCATIYLRDVSFSFDRL